MNTNDIEARAAHTVPLPRVWATYSRTNKRVQWRYSEWAGLWASPEEAEEKIREHYAAGQKVQYRCENRATDEVIVREITI